MLVLAMFHQVLFHHDVPCFVSSCGSMFFFIILFLFCLIMFVIVLLYLIGSYSVPSFAPLPSVQSCWLLFSSIMLDLVLFYKVAYKTCPVLSCCSLFCYIMCYATNIFIYPIYLICQYVITIIYYYIK